MLRNHIQSINVFKLKSYMIEETPTTPFVGISVIDNSFLIQGEIFLSQRGPTFRSEVLKMLDRFYEQGNELSKIRIDLNVMEQGSFSWIYEVLEKVFVQYKGEDEIDVTWYYNNQSLEGLLEGQKISAKTGVPMDFVSKD